MRDVVEVNMPVAAVQRVDARQHRPYFAFHLVLLLLGRDKFERAESVGEVSCSVLHETQMRLIDELVQRRLQ